MLTLPQILILILAILAYGVAGLLALLARRNAGERLQRGIRLAGLAGLLLATALFTWHSLAHEGPWRPLGDNVAALLGIVILISGFLLYLQFRHPIAAIELFLLPVIVALLVLAGFFGQLVPQQYLPTTWSVVHRVTTFLGAAAFAVAAATGALYLRADRALRSKRLEALSPSTSLERLSSVNYTAVTLGFGLLSIGCITGFIWMRHLHEPGQSGPEFLAISKIHFAVAAWIVYAIVLHSPITPHLRGRRNAWLSIGGFVLLLLSVLAVIAMPWEGR